MVQACVDPNRAWHCRAQYICAVLQPRSASVVLEMGTDGWCGLECGEHRRAAGPESAVCRRLANGAGCNLSHQPFRSFRFIRIAPGMAAFARSSLHVAQVSYTGPVPAFLGFPFFLAGFGGFGWPP